MAKFEKIIKNEKTNQDETVVLYADNEVMVDTLLREGYKEVPDKKSKE